MNDEYKILNPILHCNNPKFERIANVSRRTWMRENKKNNIFSFFYQGGSEESNLNNDILKLSCEDYWVNSKNIGIEYVSTMKMVKMFEYCLNSFRFDYLFRTSSSTYVSYRLLLEHCKNIKSNLYYGGKVVTNNCKDTHNEDIKYCLGHGFILSRDLVESLVANQDELLSYDLIDDLAVGKFTMNNNVEANSTDMQNYRWFEPDKIEELKLIYAHRCKPQKWPINEDEWVGHLKHCFELLDRKNGESK